MMSTSAKSVSCIFHVDTVIGLKFGQGSVERGVRDDILLSPPWVIARFKMYLFHSLLKNYKFASV